MYVHKFTSGDVSLYAFGGQARPSLEAPITASSWTGKAMLNNANVIKAIEDIKGASYGTEEKPAAPAPGTPAPAEVKKATWATLSSHIRYMAEQLSK